VNIAAQLKDNLKVAAFYGLIIGAAFWIPDIVIHGIRGKSFSSPDVRIMTVLLPLFGTASLYIVRKMRRNTDIKSCLF